MSASATIIFAKQALINGVWTKSVKVDIHDSTIREVTIGADPRLIAQPFTTVAYLTPSYVDLQVNGGAGVLLDQAVTADDILTVAKAHQPFGTGALLPTLITNNTSTMLNMANAVSAVLHEPDVDVLGVHFEGPWLATAKKGIHLTKHIRPPSDQELQCITRKDIGKVMVTLAPEMVPIDIIQDLVQQGVVVSLGHTNAQSDSALAAIAAGASGFTHLYNAMSGFSGRAPGVIGAALSDLSTYAGMIVDLHHVHPTSLRAAMHAKGTDYSVLVTDAMAHVGSVKTRLPYFDLNIQREGDKLTTPDGSLAGSCLTMHQAVQNTVTHCAQPWATAVKMASLNPLKWLGLTHLGDIASGLQANLLGCSTDQSRLDNTICDTPNLHITEHWVKGKCIYER